MIRYLLSMNMLLFQVYLFTKFEEVYISYGNLLYLVEMNITNWFLLLNSKELIVHHQFSEGIGFIPYFYPFSTLVLHLIEYI